MPNKWKSVTRDELINFIKSYPYPLTQDFFMDVYSWNDFRNNKKWPESMVATAYEMFDTKEYKIRKDLYNAE